jgi:hypothetical protein
MLYKYYTAELIRLDGGKLEIPSITIKTWFFRNPINAVDMIKNQLVAWGHYNHRIINLRRIT